MNYKSSAELKALAREQLKGKFGVPVGAVLITGLISIVASIIAALFNSPESTTSIIIYYLITIIISLLSVVLSMGLIKFFLNFCKNQNYQIGDIFWGFVNHPDKAIVAALLLMLIMAACLIPGILLIIVFALTENILIFVVMLLALIAGSVVMIIFNYTYGLVYYILADEPDYTAIEALKASRVMMKGHKGRLFYIQISFIGWYLLSLFTCYIALLWIYPYVLCTTTYFYLDLKGEFRESIVEDEYNSYFS